MKKLACIIGLIVLACDQVTKTLILNYLTSKSIALLPFFNLTLVWNKGISFGMFSNSESFYAPLALVVISLVIICFLIIWLTRVHDKGLAIAICAIIAGAFGNIIDRIRFGAVVDFLDFHAFGWHYPAFNIADSAIVLGIAFVLFDSIFWEPKRNNDELSSDA